MLGILKEFSRLNQNIEKLIAIVEKSMTAQDGNESSKHAVRFGDLYVEASDDCRPLLDFVRMLNHSAGREEPSK